MTIMPSFTCATAPPPKVIVIPAQSSPTEAVLAWLRKAAQTADLTMSVCTGAYVLAKDVDKATAPRSTYRGKAYYFCLEEHKTLFDSAPGRFVAA